MTKHYNNSHTPTTKQMSTHKMDRERERRVIVLAEESLRRCQQQQQQQQNKVAFVIIDEYWHSIVATLPNDKNKSTHHLHMMTATATQY
jgi:hypothetical protein